VVLSYAIQWPLLLKTRAANVIAARQAVRYPPCDGGRVKSEEYAHTLLSGSVAKRVADGSIDSVRSF
jgi:hypothetical protein